MVNVSSLGLIAGLLLGIAAAAGGFGGFLVALVLGAVGYAIGGHVAGEIDLNQLVRGRERRPR